MRTRSRVRSWPLQETGHLGQDRAQLGTRADGDDHQRHLGVGAEELCALADAVGGAVDAEQDRGAEQAVAAQQVDDGDEGGTPPDTFIPTTVDGQLGRLVQLLG